MSAIYINTNIINGKRYVGQTIRNPPIQRWQHHLGWAKRDPSKSDMLITKAIRKYGSTNFTIDFHKLHDGASQNLLNQMECLAIAKYNAMVPNGYNLKEGGSNGRFSEEAKKHVRVGVKGKSRKGPPSDRKGIPLSEAHKEALKGPKSEACKLAMSRAQKGVPKSTSHKLAMSRAKIGIPRGPLSKKHKIALSKALKGKPNKRKGIPLSELHKLNISIGRKRFYAQQETL